MVARAEAASAKVAPEPPPTDEEAAASDGQSLSAVLRQLSGCALRNEDVKAIRLGGGAGAMGEGTAAAPGDAEPRVTSRAERKAWVAWAKQAAKAHADTVHPRRFHADGRVTPLPFGAKPNDILESMGGIVPSLYLEFLKLCLAFSVLGALISVPSYLYSWRHAPEVYTDLDLITYPTATLRFATGARHACATEECQQINTLAAILEAIYSLFLLHAIAHFRRRVLALNETNEANNVFTSEYAIQLHGMPKGASAADVKAHLEATLPAASGLSAAQCAVWDVALITHCTSVLRDALRQAPLERKFAVLDASRAAGAFGPGPIATPL